MKIVLYNYIVKALLKKIIISYNMTSFHVPEGENLL